MRKKQTMSDNKTITLKYPFEHDGMNITELPLRRPKVGDMEAMEKNGSSEMAKAIGLTARLSGLAPDAVRKIDGEDFIAINKVLSDFLDMGGG